MKDMINEKSDDTNVNTFSKCSNQKKKDDYWYSANQLLSHNCFVSFVMSPRGNGKTYDFKRRCVRAFLKNGDQAIYMRRNEKEIDKQVINMRFQKDIEDIGEFPNHEFRTTKHGCFIREKVEEEEEPNEWQPFIQFMALSTSVGEKSVPYPKVNLVGFDEYIVPQSRNSKYLKNEMVLFWEAMETIIRLRTSPRIIFMANAISFVNPLFTFFDIHFPKNANEKRFHKFCDNGICVELFTHNGYTELKKNTPMGRLLANTKIGKYQMENKVLEDTEDFIKERGKGLYVYQSSFRIEGKEIGIWYNKSDHTIYCDYKIDQSCKFKFILYQEDMKEGYFYYKTFKNHIEITRIKHYAARGRVYYLNQEIKKLITSELLPKL